jgi:hypothetical protein
MARLTRNDGGLTMTDFTTTIGEKSREYLIAELSFLEAHTQMMRVIETVNRRDADFLWEVTEAIEKRFDAAWRIEAMKLLKNATLDPA